MNKLDYIAATDIDGTIVYKNSKLDELNTKLLLEFQEKSNNALTIVTGRNYFISLFAIKQLKITLPVICSNGASLIDPSTHKYIAKNHFTIDKAKNILNQIDSKNVDVSMSSDFRAYFKSKNIDYYFLKEDGITLDMEEIILDKSIHLFSSLNELISNAGQKDESFPVIVAYPSNNEQLMLVKEVIKTNNLECLIYPHGEVTRVEIFNTGVSKCWGVNQLLKHLNIKEEQIFLFGDGHNDLPMFNNFPNCFAVSNAIDELKNLAKEVIDNVQNGAVGKKLLKIIEKNLKK